MKHLKYIFLLLLIFSQLNCNNQYEQWDEVIVDSQISQDSVFNRMDTEKEIFSFHERDTSMKKTSDVQYSYDDTQDDKYSKFNNCRAYFYKSDTLTINIGIGNGFSANGFIIKYKSNKFFTKPYFFTDQIMEGESEPTYKLIYQKLTLDKSNYKIGDSLYGKIDFKSIEYDGFFKKIKHSGKGYFRSKIKPSRQN